MSSRPTPTTAIQEEAYAALTPMAFAETQPQINWALLYYCGAIATMLDQIELYVRGVEGTPWGLILNPELAPAEVLPWLSQLNGVVLIPGDSEAGNRYRIQTTDGMKRGTLAAFIAAGQRYLTGAKQVFINERDTSAYHFSVVTLDTETPDAALVEAAFLEQKPAGLVMDYSVSAGVTYALIEAEYADYADIDSTFLTYHGVLTDTPGT